MEWAPALNPDYLAESTLPKLSFIRHSASASQETAKSAHLKGSEKKKPVVENGPEYIVIFFLLATALTFQLALSLGSYSGEGKPPMHGDFEAQRHWMEITYHLPVEQWYVNGENNDLQYWGLDYPPLTAYHSYVMGAIAHRINPSWVALEDSRGIETTEHKLWMRLTAILPFYCIYFPAVLWFVFRRATTQNLSKTSLCALALLYPGLVIIDNGHFQYNSVSLGFFLISFLLLSSNSLPLGSFFFVLALNYKQMELYHSLPIFVFILSRCLKRPVLPRLLESIKALIPVGIVVLGTFALLWLPFIAQGLQHVQLVLGRIFPFYRGLYEDKVASVWCSFSFILKLNRYMGTDAQIKLSTACVLLASLPSLLILFLRSTEKNFRLSLYITSLSFFLFSFQVHEKSILIPAISAILLIPDYPVLAMTFLHVTNTSLMTLCLKDGIGIAFLLMVAYFFVTFMVVIRSNVAQLGRKMSYLHFIVVLLPFIPCLLEMFGPSPPPRLPDIYPLLNAVVSCVYFGFCLLISYGIMLTEEWQKRANVTVKKDQ